MTELEIMQQRHSVRQYADMPIEQDKRTVLNELAEKLNADAGVHIQIIYDEPKCFDSFMAHYGKFSGVKNYIALVGKKSPSLDEALGYCGEQLVLKAQELGLNTCWVAMTHILQRFFLFSHGFLFRCGLNFSRGSSLRPSPL